jgi:hypothetical protein
VSQTPSENQPINKLAAVWSAINQKTNPSQQGKTHEQWQS